MEHFKEGGHSHDLSSMKAIMGEKRRVQFPVKPRRDLCNRMLSMYCVCFLSHCVREGCVFHFSPILGQPFSLCTWKCLYNMLWNVTHTPKNDILSRSYIFSCFSVLLVYDIQYVCSHRCYTVCSALVRTYIMVRVCETFVQWDVGVYFKFLC